MMHYLLNVDLLLSNLLLIITQFDFNNHNTVYYFVSHPSQLLMTQAKGFVGTIKTMLPERPAKASDSEPHPHPPPQPSSPSHSQPSHVEELHVHDQHGPIKKQQSLSMGDGFQPVGGEDMMDWTDMNSSRIRLFGLDEMKEVGNGPIFPAIKYNVHVVR